MLSGVNQGPNTGHAVLHSGTVGAAFTAATFGLPAMAVSLTVRDAPLWQTAAAIVRVVLPWATALEPPSVLNVNVPAVDVAELRPLQVATLAPFGAVQTTITERGEGYVKLGYTEISAEADGAPTPASSLAVCPATRSSGPCARCPARRATLSGGQASGVRRGPERFSWRWRRR